MVPVESSALGRTSGASLRTWDIVGDDSHCGMEGLVWCGRGRCAALSLTVYEATMKQHETSEQSDRVRPY